MKTKRPMVGTLFTRLCLCASFPMGACGGSAGQQRQQVDDVSKAPALQQAEAAHAGTSVAAGRDLSEVLVDAHNHYRADHGASPLTWSNTLASVAQSWADRLLADGCRLVHSDGDTYGENLFFGGPPGAFGPEKAVDTWYSEVKDYSFNDPGFSMKTGHFTQVVWRGTREVGCGASVCPSGDIVVCNYSPPGNVRGEYTENVLRK